MFLSEYITHLQTLAKEHGGMLEVEKWMPAKGRHSAPPPELAYSRKYPARAGLPAFFHEPTDNEVQRGTPVVRV